DNEVNDTWLAENIRIKYVSSVFVPLSDSIVVVPLLNKWIKQLSNLIRSEACDLIHVCDYEYLTSIPPIITKDKYKIPIIIVNDAIIGIYSFGTPSMDFLAKVYTYTLGIKILSSYDKVVFLYSNLAKQAKKLGLSSEKTEIIPNGIDINEINNYVKVLEPEKIKEKYGIKKDKKVILYVGRLVKVKRVEIIIYIIRELLNRNLNVVGLIVGDGPQRFNLEKKAKFLGLKHSIIFTGYLKEEEKYECYSIADLFILPSISEGLPTVLLEAASFGLPIVATNTGGVTDIVIHGKTGFLVNSWDYDQYAKYAGLLLIEQDLARKVGENARKHVEKNFSWDKVVKKYEKVYSEALEEVAKR
ncbi:MAG: glycosyltransferase family 4 protein, partial [Fervidobacterium sp.]